MKCVRFNKDGGACFGIVEGNQVLEISGIHFGPQQKTGNRYPLDSVSLLPPVMPPTIYCAGHNYRDHIIKSAKRKGIDPVIPEKPDFNYRAVNALVGAGADVVIPKDAAGHRIHFEPELVCVIGREAKHVGKAEAMDHVFGYTIGNDVSDRTWQHDDRTNWRAKNTDTFKPMGPWIETDVDLNAMRTIARVNGEVLLDYETNNVLFDVATCVSALSRYVTLVPGDVIWMGSEGESPDMKPGDVNEIEITGIGVLRNTFVAEQ